MLRATGGAAPCDWFPQRRGWPRAWLTNASALARDGGGIGRGRRRKRRRENDPEIVAATREADRVELRVGDVGAESFRQQLVQRIGARRTHDADRGAARGGVAFGRHRIREFFAAWQPSRDRIEPRVRAQRRDLPRRRPTTATARRVDRTERVRRRRRRRWRSRAAPERKRDADRRDRRAIRRAASHAPRRSCRREPPRPRPFRRESRRSGGPTDARTGRRGRAASRDRPPPRCDPCP